MRLCDMDPTLVVGGRILKTCCYLGSYGMGGPGFVGLKVRGSAVCSFWVVVTVWGASEWLTIDGKPCREGYFEEERRDMENRMGAPLPSLLSLKGNVIDSIEMDSQHFLATLSAGGSVYQLRLLADSSSLPVHRGSKEPKVMEQGEDIRNAIIISRRANLWLLSLVEGE